MRGGSVLREDRVKQEERRRSEKGRERSAQLTGFSPLTVDSD